MGGADGFRLPARVLRWAVEIVLDTAVECTRAILLLVLGAGASLAGPAPVSQRTLDDAIDRADRLVVQRDCREHSPVLYESMARRDLAAFKGALRIVVPEGELACGCPGTPFIALYSGGREIAWITNHHGETMGSSLWRSHAMIADQERYLAWFDERGLDGPRREVAEMKLRREQSALAREKWTNAMPPCLRSAGGAVFNFAHLDVTALKRRLEQSYDSPSAAILALLCWYGSGQGPWAGYSAYEDVPAQILSSYSKDDVVASVTAIQLSPPQTEGLARLVFCAYVDGHAVLETRLLPVALLKELLDHCSSSGDAYKIRQAKGRLE